MPESKLEELSSKELVEFYNRLTKKSIKRFASRAEGLRRTKTALKEAEPAVRKVDGAVASGKVGRPQKEFSVTLTEGVSKLNPESARAKLAQWLDLRPGKTATLQEIQKDFSGDMRGVIQKMISNKHLKRTDA